jgi:hypothetical protein
VKHCIQLVCKVPNIFQLVTWKIIHMNSVVANDNTDTDSDSLARLFVCTFYQFQLENWNCSILWPHCWSTMKVAVADRWNLWFAVSIFRLCCLMEEWLVNWKGCGCGLIEVLSRHLHEWSEGNHEKPVRIVSWDLNWAPPEYKSEMSLLEPTDNRF